MITLIIPVLHIMMAVTSSHATHIEQISTTEISDFSVISNNSNSPALFSATENIIAVNMRQGDDSLCQETKSPCRTLEGAYQFYKRNRDDVIISIETNVSMSTVFEIINSRNIGIRGSTATNLTTKVAITCTASNAGFKIYNVTNFNISHLSLVNCSLNGSSANSYNYAILLELSSNIFLENISALVLIIDSIQITIWDIKFENDSPFNQDEKDDSVSITDVRDELSVSFPLSCPPGFHVADGHCVCASGRTGYRFVLRCNDSQAHIRHHLWVGYIISSPRLNDSLSEDKNWNFTNLYSAPCPTQLCRYNAHILPNSSTDLNEAICRDRKEGILCGRCANNYSTYYHSRDFTCGPNERCHLGILFYILSEIVPMAVLFVIVVTFDFSFTSGESVSFIFFTQYLKEVSIHINNTFSHLRSPYRIFYGIFNFDFFMQEELSFCLWRDAQIMDIIAFKYVTIVIAFGLVLTLTGILHRITCIKLHRFRSRMGTKTSVIHGISAFLVMCYSQCTELSFTILKYTQPDGFNGKLGEYYSHYGGLPFFDTGYLIYSVPAVLSLVIVTILPPLVLILYPLSLQILSLCSLSEHWLVNKILRWTFVHQLMPFFDCFQSCYKDSLRFFAGLHFVYRIGLLLSFSLAMNGYEFNMYYELILLVILGIHSTIQPYKLRLHNMIESLILLDLALINACVIVSKEIIRNLDQPDIHAYKRNTTLLVINSLQLVLIYLPMLIIVYQASRVSIECFRRRFRKDFMDSVPVNDILDYETERNKMEFLSSSDIVSSNSTTFRDSITAYNYYGSIES